MSPTVKLESGDGYLVTDSCFTNRIYLIVEERKGANNPKGGVALAQLNKEELGRLVGQLQVLYYSMT